MRFALTDDQATFLDAARELLANECTMPVVRAAWEAPPGEVDRTAWEQLEAIGVFSVLVPESLGGLGLDECVLIPIVQETGWFALPYPVVETAMVGAPLGVHGVVATDLGGDLVPWAADADVLLLRAGDALRAYQPDEVCLTPFGTVDRARRAATVTVLGSGALVTDDHLEVATARRRGALGVAAQLVGLSRRMLDLTVGYVTERHQFGVPVGSFQAVKHMLANALVQCEFAATAVLRAAYPLATHAPTATRDVSMAKVLATDASMITGRAALQCHGAIGYTVEYDLHLLMKRAWALARAWGDRAFHADVVAAILEEKP